MEDLTVGLRKNPEMGLEGNPMRKTTKSKKKWRRTIIGTRRKKGRNGRPHSFRVSAATTTTAIDLYKSNEPK
jgi:hypothetical protein